jgi:predicted flap endonuclease-1-like 5' DNA nuclease
MQTALERAQARISDLEAGLRAKRAAVNAAAEQEQAATRRIEQLEGEISDLRARADDDAEGHERLRAEMEVSIAEKRSLQARVAELEIDVSTIPALEAARDAAQARAAALETELSRTVVPLPGMFEKRAPEAVEEDIPDSEAEAEAALEGDDDPEPESGDEPEGVVEPDEEPLERPGVAEVPLWKASTAATDESAAAESGEEESEGASEPGEPPEDATARAEAEQAAAVEAVTERFRLPEGPETDDDLQEIYGIGPALERLLHSMNIFTFAQIAGFTEEDVDLVSTALGKAFPDRVRRDDWIGSARGLHRLKYGEEP